MFNIGPPEIVVLVLVGLIVLGPDRLPDFARDAARLLRSLRDMATGAREQLRDELGPEFADLDLRNLNPRAAVTRAVFGDDAPDLQKYNPRSFEARAREFLAADGESAAADKPVSMTKPTGTSSGSQGGSAGGGRSSASDAAGRPRPRPRPGGSSSGSSAGGVAPTYDTDAT